MAVISCGTIEKMDICNHEEADTRLVVHIHHALRHGASHCMVRTVDTDAIVILIGIMHTFTALYPTADIWAAFGSGRNYRYYHINLMVQLLGRQKACALPLFHSFSGCDTTSSF